MRLFRHPRWWYGKVKEPSTWLKVTTTLEKDPNLHPSTWLKVTTTLERKPPTHIAEGDHHIRKIPLPPPTPYSKRTMSTLWLLMPCLASCVARSPVVTVVIRRDNSPGLRWGRIKLLAPFRCRPLTVHLLHLEQHIEAETKWPPFRRRHFQMHFVNENVNLYEIRERFYRSLFLRF